jgi:hypothetical protein
LEQLEENKYRVKAFHKDFIGIYEEVLTKEKCQQIVDDMDLHINNSPSEVNNGNQQFPNGDVGRKDYQIFANRVMADVFRDINQVLDICVQAYVDEFFVIKNIGSLRSDEVKLQMTPPRGGYHVWHSEQGPGRSKEGRVLVWTAYLNDIPDGEGETEFLWQGVRVKPRVGTICIFPAAFTHTHRGNPVYSCNKYIATGWYNFNE